MRYTAEQKTETHKQIVDAASKEFRGKGLQGIGIADLMSQVGLTHGGFYAHFKDRDALVVEAVECAAMESFGRMNEVAKSAPQGKEVNAIIDIYLSPEHRDNFRYGCLLPAIAADIARQSDSVKGAFTESLQANMSGIAKYMPAKNSKDKLDQAMMLISSMAGAMLIARAINDSTLSNMLLDSVRSQLLNLYNSWGA
ncbi:MAG: TetR/AcrR family transcriptional regulator [Methylobacter sp.]|nr:TetR/AcrR family transcriptional regulator [Methylobacter sp.]